MGAILTAILEGTAEKLGIQWISDLVGWLLGKPTTKAPVEESAQDLAADKAKAETELTEQENANATLTKAAAAGTAADTAVMHDEAKPSGLDADPAGHWRD